MKADDHAAGSRRAARFTNLSQLRHYQRGWLRGDLVAGVTVAAYLVPQVMAYAEVAGVPAIAGLWAVLPCLAVYALLGTSRQLSVGPESTTALLTASIVAPLAGGDPARYAGIAAELALIFGAFCVVAWLLRLGFVAELLSRPVLVGYLAGVAIIMAVGQLGRVGNVHVTGNTLWSELSSLAGKAGDIRLASVAIAAATIAILIVVGRWPVAPGALIAVIVMTAAVSLLGLESHGVAVVGTLHGGLPRPGFPPLSGVGGLLLPALGILVVGYTDNVLTARAFATRGEYEIDANQELLALGGCNLGAALFHGFPVSSSASRTALGDAAGSRSQLYSISALGTALIAIAFLRPLLAHFPLAALGGIVIYAAARLIDMAEFRRLARFRRRELMLATAATVGVLTLNILYGVLVAIAMSVIELLGRVARPHDAILGIVPGLPGMHDVDDYPQAQQVAGLLVYRYDAPLFFANAEDFRRRALESVRMHEPVAWFVLNVEAIVEVDITGLDALERVRSTLAGRGIVVALARVKQDLLDDLESYGLVKTIGVDRLFPTLPSAVAAFEAWSGEPGDDQARTTSR